MASRPVNRSTAHQKDATGFNGLSAQLKGYTLPGIYNENSGNLGDRKQAPPLVDSLMDSKLLIVIVM